MPKARVAVALFALIAIASCTKKASPTESKPKVSAAEAGNLYTQYCAKCHGATGKEGRAPNLTKIEDGKGEIVGTITNGAGRMPSFADKMSKDQIDALAGFVLTLKK